MKFWKKVKGIQKQVSFCLKRVDKNDKLTLRNSIVWLSNSQMSKLIIWEYSQIRRRLPSDVRAPWLINKKTFIRKRDVEQSA